MNITYFPLLKCVRVFNCLISFIQGVQNVYIYINFFFKPISGNGISGRWYLKNILIRKLWLFFNKLRK